MGMNIRPFDWRDLPALHRYRHESLYLDSARLLTQGPQFFPVSAVFSYFATAAGILTFRSQEDGDSRRLLIGQVVYKNNGPSARIAFLAPESSIYSPDLPDLIERMAAESGERGAYHLLAEVDEDHAAFEILRKTGFAIYARQRIWQLTGEPVVNDGGTAWKIGSSRDVIPIKAFFCNLVPGLVQQIEPPPTNRLSGLVYREQDEIFAYVEVKYGPQGIWMQPYIHPDMEDVTGKLADLINHLPNRRSRPVYLCVRSYQSWLEAAIERLGSEAGPRQAVLVKRLTVPQKQERSLPVHALERGNREASAPLPIRRQTRSIWLKEK